MVFLSVGLAIGLIAITYVFLSRQSVRQYSDVLNQQIIQLQQQLRDAGEDLIRERSFNAVLEERCQRLSQLEEINSQLTNERNSLKIENTSLKTQQSQQDIYHQEKLQALEKVNAQLQEVFKQLSTEALNSNNQKFVDIAKQTLNQWQEVVLTPLQQSLTQVDHKIAELEKSRVSAYDILRHQVHDLLLSQKELRSETANLVKALRAPQVRGQWGEMQLKRVVEMAGMIDHCDFIEQASFGEEGRIRPDMIVNLPGGKKIVVDAKAPLAAYLEALEAVDDHSRQKALTDHARHVRQHIKALSQRAYWDQIETTPEFVILFLPGETFFSAALESDPTLIEVGVKEKVILATPTTLIAMLRAIAYGWRQETIAEEAREIANLGQELYKRLQDFIQHWGRVGKGLSQAVEIYNQSIGTFERRLLVSARKLAEFNGKENSADLPALVDNLPRIVNEVAA